MDIIYDCGCTAKVYFRIESYGDATIIKKSIEDICEKHKKDGLEELIYSIRKDANNRYKIPYPDAEKLK